MIFSQLLLVLLSCLFILAPAWAGSETLTTYYPAPSGNYNRISANMIQYGPSTLTQIQAQYKCSYNPGTRWPPCPAGISFYNTDAHALYVSDGTHWTSVNATCVAINPCSKSQNCGTDDCGVSCGTCPPTTACAITALSTQGRCM